MKKCDCWGSHYSCEGDACFTEHFVSFGELKGKWSANTSHKDCEEAF